MNNPLTQIAVLHDTKQIIAAGADLAECVAKADATGMWDKAPGTVAPYFFTRAASREFWGAWFAPGFWAGGQREVACI